MAKDDQTLDTNALDRLMRIGGRDLLDQMVDLFLEQAPVYAETLSYLHGDVELAEVERAAHSLKTGAAHVGAIRLSELAGQMEHAAARHDLEMLRDQEKVLRARLEWATDQLRRLRAGVDADVDAKEVPSNA